MGTRLHLVSLAVVLVLTVPAHAQRLQNGGFEKGKDHWGLSQQEMARAELVVVDGNSPAEGKVGKVTVTVNGPPHRLQLTHTFANEGLVTDKGYALSFFARAEEPTSFRVILMNRDKPWENLGLSRAVTVDAKWKAYQFPFRARASGQEFGKVNFFLGQTKGILWLDGVKIEPYEASQVQPDGPTLATDDWSLQFFKSGGLGRLTHKPTGRVLIEPVEGGLAFEVTLLKGGAAETISNETADVIRCETLGEEIGYRFIADAPQATVTMTYRIDEKTGMLECRSEIDNKTDKAVTRVRFPIVNAPEVLGDKSEDDVLLYPIFDGAVVDDPKKAFRRGKNRVSNTYPGSISCQVMAVCDPAAGLYMASHDPDGHGKAFTVEAGFHHELSIAHLAPYVEGADLCVPYPIVIGTFAGNPKRGGTSWYDAAKIYRDWSQQQEWAKLKVRTRKDMPDWLREGGLVTFYNPRQITPPGDVSKLEAFLKDYSTRFSTPMLPNNRGYERYGTWCGQEYLPVMPDEATFRAAAEVTKKLGGRSMIMLSGYRWTLERTTPEKEEYSSQERFDKEVSRFAVCDMAGKPVIGTSEKKNDYRGRKFSRMCRATDFAKQTIVDVSTYCVRNGYSCIHFDQECSGGYSASVCWSKDHGHPRGHGRWIHEAMADLYRRLCETCRRIDPDFMLSMEEPNELYIPWLNLCQSRPYGITPEWPAAPPMTRSVPLFMYLYHENLIGWAAFYPWKSGGRPCYSLAKGFTVGQMPGLVPPQNLRIRDPKRHDNYIKLFTNCMKGYRGFAHDYLVWGRMLRPLALDIPKREFKWKRRDKGEYDIVVPAVSHEVWQLDDGRIGIVFVNPETESHEVGIDLSALLPAGALVRIRELSNRGGEQAHNRPEFRLTLPALDMLLLEVSPN